MNRKEKKMLSGSIDKYSRYQKELEKFFKNIPKGQLAVETIIINWIPRILKPRNILKYELDFIM